jgi:hypothetical protein
MSIFRKLRKIAYLSFISSSQTHVASCTITTSATFSVT